MSAQRLGVDEEQRKTSRSNISERRNEVTELTF